MKESIKWIVWGALLLVIFLLGFSRTPDQITSKLSEVSSQAACYSLIVHGIYLAVIVIGLLFMKIRNFLFFALIAFLSLSATVIAIASVIVPNIIVFGMFFVLTVYAWARKQLNFDLKNLNPVTLVFGAIGIFFGFWYLHWVESPVLLNALLFSPLGVVNCPTMLAVSGFLALTRQPRSMGLEATVALITLYFGFFGMFRLGAYVDVTLILCSLFLLVRLGSYLPAGTFEATRTRTRSKK